MRIREGDIAVGAEVEHQAGHDGAMGRGRDRGEGAVTRRRPRRRPSMDAQRVEAATSMASIDDAGRGGRGRRAGAGGGDAPARRTVGGGGSLT